MKDDPAVQWIPSGQTLLQGGNPRGVRDRRVRSGLQLQSHQLPVLLEDQIHLASRTVTPEMDATADGVDGSPGLAGLKDRLLEPETDVRPFRELILTPDARQERREAGVGPEKLRCLHQGRGRIRRVGRHPGEQVPRLDEIEVAMGGGLGEGGVAGDLRLVEKPARPVRSNRHQPLKVWQARHVAELPEIPFEIGLDVSGKPEPAGLV